MKVVVVGTGYVGLVTGVVLAEVGHDVTCIDIDEKKIEIMRSGKSPIYENGLEELMQKNANRIIYTTDYKTAYESADIIFIGVGTPERADGSANLDYVYGVCKQIATNIVKDCVVVIKSTVPIGTNDDIQKYFNENSKYEIAVASNPEFLAQGTAVEDTMYASRIVVGFESELAGKKLAEVYKPLTEEPYNIPYLEMNWQSAEMVKYASNNFLALKVSYINEIANLCEIMGANIDDVSNGMGYDTRIGNKFLKAGIGYGGSCFPKDTKALYFISNQLEEEITTVKACIEVNEKQKIRLFNRMKNDIGDLKGMNIGILGVTFKPNTDDLRDAPSIENVKLLLDYGANVTVYDPVGLDNFRRLFDDSVTYVDSVDECIKGKDSILICTEWEQIRNYPIENYAKLMKTPNVYDGRNCYNLEDTRKASINYKSIGR